MGSRFVSEFVYAFDQNNAPHFVVKHYMAKMDGSYHLNIYLENKSYCVNDYYLTDEVEEEGDFLPRVKETEWREFFSAGPSLNVSTILAEAGLSDITVSKLVFVYMESSSRQLLEFDGFVSSGDGVQNFDPDFMAQAISFARAKTASPAEQESLSSQWIVEQVQNHPEKFRPQL